MNVEKAIYKRRTIRRYEQVPIPSEILRKLVDLARIAPMSVNIQYLEYIIINTSQNRERLFPCLTWSSLLLPAERIMEENKRPMAYIIVCVNTEIKKKAGDEIGAAIQNMLLGATSFGLGACWLGSIDKKKIREIFSIPDFYAISYVISLGFPAEESRIEPYKDSFKYWKENNIMHVPKRELYDIIIKEI